MGNLTLLSLSLLATSTLVLSQTLYKVQTPPLTTNWTYTLGTNPWPEHPRPLLKREKWLGLNGLWTYSPAGNLSDVNSPPFGSVLEKEVLVPSCLESGISGIQAAPGDALYSWFSTNFTVPKDWTANNQVLLNFGAVDYEATVFVNGKEAGFHRGGYFRFTVDVTSFLKIGGNNELLVFVHDPTDTGDYVIPIGKQTTKPSHIFYTPCSGIWGSVWLESAPENYISGLEVAANMFGVVNVTLHTNTTTPTPFTLTISNSTYHLTKTLTSDSPTLFNVSHPSLWSPTSPSLYNISITLGSDTISSYTGFRTIEKGVVNGIVRPLLNGEFIFQFGTLDQGFWPDGLYVPPNREAMVYDLQVLKSLGFNGFRKHIKLENDLFYQACDQLGLLVIQDMPALRPLQSHTLADGTTVTYVPDADQQAEFTRQLVLLVNQLKSFVSIGTWVIYNEGWGQITEGYYPEFGLTDLVKSLDPSRLVDSTTGWVDHGAGDYSDNHHYANPQCGSPFYSIASAPYDPTRIGFQGEFGGIGLNVSIEHLWNNQASINTINQTYEIDLSTPAWNYRAHLLLTELKEQTEMFACSGGVWTQTTDVEGEVNGLMTYDRRVLRCDVKQWKADIAALYAAAKSRTGKNGNATAAGADWW